MVNLLKNFDFGQNFSKIPTFFRKFRTISILVKIYEIFRIFLKFHNKYRFWSNYWKISILVKISKKIRFIFEIFFRKKNRNFLVKFFRKISILVNIFENFRFLIFSKISKNFVFGQNLEKLRFCSNFRKLFDFRKNCGKFRFSLNFPKILI